MRWHSKAAAACGAGRYAVEALERRRLLTASLQNVPTWVEQGPGPILNGQTAGLTDNPVTGAVQSIAVRPTDSGTVFLATTAGGIWRTLDVSASPVSWTPLTDQLPSLAISSIAFSPFDTSANTIFAGTGSFTNDFGHRGDFPGIGVLRSTNLGSSWQILGGATFAGATINRVLPTVQTLAGGSRVHILLVATDNGLFRSTTGGDPVGAADEGFTKLSGIAAGAGLPGGPVSDVVADPSGTGRFYCAIPGTGIFQSIDFGRTWVAVNGTIPGLAASDNIKLAVHFNTSTFSKAVYAGVVSGNVLAGVFRTTDNAATWRAVGTAPAIHPGTQGDTNFSITADPFDPALVYVAGDRQATMPFVGNAFVGSATTNRWSTVVLDGAAGTAPHADSRSMVFSGNDILESDDGGVYRLTNASSSTRKWTPLVGNLRVAEVNSVAYDPARNELVAGAQDTGSFNQNAAINASQSARFAWNEMAFLQGDGALVDVDTLNTFLGSSDPLRYASSQFLHFFQRVGGSNIPSFVGMNLNGLPLFVTRHVNDTFTDGSGNEHGAFDPTLQFDTPFALNRVDGSRMVVGSDFLYESSDQGDHFNTVGGALRNLNSNGLDDDHDGQTDEGDEFAPPTAGRVGTVTALAYGGRSGTTAFPDMLLVGTEGLGGTGFFRTRYAGTGLPVADAHYPGNVVRDIAVDAGNCRTVWVLDSDGAVWQGRFVGQSSENWSNVTFNLNNVRALDTIAVVGTGASAVPIVGGALGAFRLDPNTGSRVWDELGAGLPNATVTDLRYDTTDDVLVAATFGRGAFTISGASNFVGADAVLAVDGTVNDDDIRIGIDPDNPLLLKVQQGIAVNRFQLGVIHSITIATHDGNDTITVDTTGNLSVSGGIAVAGGNGTDVVNLLGAAKTDQYTATGGQFQTTTLLTYNDNSILALTYDATQIVNDDVTAQILTVTATVGANTITLGDGASGTGRARVSMNDTTQSITYAPIEFSGKSSLNILGDPFNEVGFGSPDVLTLTASTDFGLTSIAANGVFADDTITVATAPAPTKVFGDAGSDTINVGQSIPISLRPPIFVSTLTAITSKLTVDGGAGSNTLSLTATRFSDGATGFVTGSAITGFGLPGTTIFYANVAALNLTLSAANNNVFVQSLLAGTTLTIDAGFGDDLIRLGSNGFGLTPTGTSTVNAIKGPVVIVGNDGSDTVVVDDSGDTASNTGTISATGITGLGLTGGVGYSTVESVRVFTGSGNDTVTNTVPAGALPAVTLDLGAGQDGIVFYGTNQSDDILVQRVVKADGPHAVITMNGQQFDMGYANGETVSVYAGNGDDVVVFDASAAVKWSVQLYGGNGKDLLVGSTSDDLLDGGNGKDVLIGGGGNDVLLNGEVVYAAAPAPIASTLFTTQSPVSAVAWLQSWATGPAAAWLAGVLGDDSASQGR